MKHIAGWFRRNNVLMAQAKDLARQLQEAWDGERAWKQAADQWEIASKKWETAYNLRGDNLTTQLHRVARERDQERELRLAAEEKYHELLYAVEKKHPNETRHETALRYIGERENQECRVAMSNERIEQVAEELRDTYLEQLENEEE